MPEDQRKNETWRRIERPGERPPHPYDPTDPDQPIKDPVPLPTDVEPPPEVPGREPGLPRPNDGPAGDPPTAEPTRLA